jgi:two-component system, sensor histidine kinase and response regulator
MNDPDTRPSSASLDAQTLARLRSLAQDTDPTLFAEILGTYSRDVEKYLAALQKALGENDAATIEHNAHALKGASINTGALALAGISGLVEAAAGRAELTALPTLFKELEDEIRRVQNDIGLELSASA